MEVSGSQKQHIPAFRGRPLFPRLPQQELSPRCWEQVLRKRLVPTLKDK
jgi:hypothetical protein